MKYKIICGNTRLFVFGLALGGGIDSDVGTWGGFEMDSNRIGRVFKAGSASAAGCDCRWPVCVPVVDVVVTAALRGGHTMSIDRHLDCLLCGPFVVRMAVVKPTGVAVRRGVVINHPVYPAKP
jgi:hypothetical protein